MLTYTYTATARTTVPVESVLSPYPHDTPVLFSYTISPLHPAYLLPMPLTLSTGEVETLLIPLQIPLSILSDLAFRDGYEYNLQTEGEVEEEGEDEAWATSVPCLVNYLYKTLTDERDFLDLATGKVLPCFLPWQVGWLLRDLTRLAETDITLALVGLAHLCFLLPFLMHTRPADWPETEPFDASLWHRQVVKAYRARMRVHREQGKSVERAQRLALVA